MKRSAFIVLSFYYFVGYFFKRGDKFLTELVNKIPVWLIVIFLIAATVLFGYAVFDGRKVEFWPLVIHEKIDMNKVTNKILEEKNGEIVILKKEVEKLSNKLEEKAPETLKEKIVISFFPEEMQRDTLNETINVNNNTLSNYREEIATLNGVINEIQKDIQIKEEELEKFNEVKNTFIFRLMRFHNDTQCYGSSLNFTAGRDKEECIKKSILADRFIEFMTELEIVDGSQKSSTNYAKKELINLQKKYNFNRQGWYSIDVFKVMIIEFHAKA